MDGLRDGGRVLYLASTNTDPSLLDRSLLRSGRFGRVVRLELPTFEERRALLAYLGARRQLAEPLDYARAAELTRGRSGADLVAAFDDGLALALADGVFDGLTWRHLVEAITRRGEIDEAPTATLTQRRRQAIHESAHAVVALELLGASVITGVTLGDHRGGRTELGPDDGSRLDLSDDEVLARVAVLVAGAIGERLFLGSGSLGGRSDATQATELLLARLAAGADSTWGSLAPEAFGMMTGPALLNARYAAVRVALDREAERAGAILERRRSAVLAFAETLLAEENLSGTALERALRSADAVSAEPTAA
jgi:ATP-dependent Zn protease